MSSFWNWGPHHHSGLPITTGLADTSAYGGTHDPETGRDVRYHSPGQRSSYLARNPGLDPASLPPVQDPNRALAWDNASTVAGEPADLRLRAERRARNAAPLLRDPAQHVRNASPTKPVKPSLEPSLFCTCVHEMSGHALVAFLLEIPVARVSVIPDGKGNLGETRHADLADTPDAIAYLLAGECAEITIFGQARADGLGSDLARARAIANRIVQQHGGNADELLERARHRVLNMMRGKTRAMRRMAFELASRKVLDFEAINQAIDRAFTRAQAVVAKAAPKKGRVIREWNFSNPRDVADWCKRNGLKPDTEPMGHADGYFVRTKR